MRPAPPIALFCVTAILLAGCGTSTRLTHSGTAGTTTVARTAATEQRASADATSVEPNSSDEVPMDVVPVVQSEFLRPLAQYTTYVEALLRKLRPQLAALHRAAVAGDRGAAQHDWLLAHISWLEIGQDDNAYGAFGQLGEAIDGKADGLPGTIGNPSFTGFHKVELDLWRRDDMAAAATDSAKLASLVGQLTPKLVKSDLPSNDTALNGWVLRAHEILEDAVRDSLSQDDDYGSNTDLSTIAADVTATREMVSLLEPLIETRAPKIIPAVARDLNQIDATIDDAGGPLAVRDLATLPARTRQALDQAVSQAVEDLAPISELMQIIAPGAT